MICPLDKSGGGSCLEEVQPADSGLGSGADDEVTGCVPDSDGQADQLAVGGRDHWSDAADDVAVAGADGRAGLRRSARPAGRKGLS
jgi:hypothetical protein